ncbi:MAG TPA: hypothetical protein VGO47_10520 [Chlamydiales bacterium]|nr:hypothetical protein [Chlamydiales bacterium]
MKDLTSTSPDPAQIAPQRLKRMSYSTGRSTTPGSHVRPFDDDGASTRPSSSGTVNTTTTATTTTTSSSTTGGVRQARVRLIAISTHIQIQCYPSLPNATSFILPRSWADNGLAPNQATKYVFSMSPDCMFIFRMNK